MPVYNSLYKNTRILQPTQRCSPLIALPRVGGQVSGYLGRVVMCSLRGFAADSWSRPAPPALHQCWTVPEPAESWSRPATPAPPTPGANLLEEILFTKKTCQKILIRSYSRDLNFDLN